MKFDYNDNENSRDFQINYQVSQNYNLHQNIDKRNLRKEVRYKRLKRLLINFTLILVELLVVILVAFYFTSPLNRISHVSVTGNRTILTNSIIHDVSARPGSSVFNILIHNNSLKKDAFKRNAQLKSIHVDVYKWNHVHIKMSEYPIVAYLRHRNQYYAVTDKGQNDSQSTRPSQIDPILSNFKTNQSLKRFIKYYEELPNNVKPDIDKIRYIPNGVDPDRVHVYMNDGNQIYANYKNWFHKMKYYPAISKSMKKRGVINMELGVYSKPFKR